MSATASPAAPTSPSPAAQRLAAVERTVAQLQTAQAEFATTVNGDLQRFGIRMSNFETMLRQREEQIRAALDQTAAQRSSELAAVVADATSEFNTQRTTLQSMASAIEAEFQKVRQELEQTGRGDGKQGKGFLPLKELKPPKLAKEEQWREWAEHFSEYLEASCAGMKQCLKAVAQQESKPDKDTVGTSPYSQFAARAEDLYAALKHLTEEKSTARQVVMSTPREDGFLAWWSLNSTFTQALAGRQGAVMNQFTASHSKAAKKPERHEG